MSTQDNEEEYENSSDVSEIDPESDVLVPVQQRIEAQLRKHLQELMQQLTEVSGKFTVIQKEREDCGVELYNAQQHLAKLQETLEKHHEKHASIQREHEERLQERDQLSAEAEGLQRNVDLKQRQFVGHQAELSKLSETLQKVERFNKQLKDEVELERRAANKTEDDITRLEREKLMQDTLVNTLQGRIHVMEEQSASLSEQLEAQRRETQAARNTLTDAMSEMEAINYEKKQLVQQWKSSLIGMQRRHDAMKKTEEALQKQKDDLQVLENEITGFRKDIQGVEMENTKLTEFVSRVDSEIAVLQRQIDVLTEQKEKSATAYALMSSTIEQTEMECKSMEQQLKLKLVEVEEVEKKIAKNAKAIVDMEGSLIKYLCNQTSLKQESQGVLRDVEKINTAIRAKELQITQMENEVARIRVDTLQAKAHNESLQGTLEELEKELQSRDAMIQRMQVDIRRRNDEIDRKQKQLDHLNHQYEQIMDAHGGERGEHVGPLEATIKSLSKAIAAKSTENEALQQEWIKLQSELVSCKNTLNDINESILETQAKATILTQKRDRLLSNISREKQEITALESKSNAMHLEMKRANTLLSKNADIKDTVANEAFLLENDLVRRLEEKKRDAIQLARKVKDTRDAKNDLIQQIMDCERDIMFWERKLQIARETEMALDPTIGRAEIEKMKKEIGFMEQRMGQLQREQKFLIEEMQKLIDRREIIRTKGKSVQKSSNHGKGGPTRFAVDKENARLFKELHAKRQEAQTKDRLIKDRLADVERIAAEVDRTHREIEAMDEQLESLQGQVMAAQKERDRAEDEKQLKQRSLQRLRDGEKGTYKLACYPEDTEREEAVVEDGKRAVIKIMEDLSAQFPDLESELQDLMATV